MHMGPNTPNTQATQHNLTKVRHNDSLT